MHNNDEQKSFADVDFNVTQEERIKSFLAQFAPDYKGYLLDQTPKQIYSMEYTLRIYYEHSSFLTITCYAAEMIQLRIHNIFNINKQARFINQNPTIQEHSFSCTEKNSEDVTVYYSATLEFEFIGT